MGPADRGGAGAHPSHQPAAAQAGALGGDGVSPRQPAEVSHAGAAQAAAAARLRVAAVLGLVLGAGAAALEAGAGAAARRRPRRPRRAPRRQLFDGRPYGDDGAARRDAAGLGVRPRPARRRADRRRTRGRDRRAGAGGRPLLALAAAVEVPPRPPQRSARRRAFDVAAAGGHARDGAGGARRRLRDAARSAGARGPARALAAAAAACGARSRRRPAGALARERLPLEGLAVGRRDGRPAAPDRGGRRRAADSSTVRPTRRARQPTSRSSGSRWRAACPQPACSLPVEVAVRNDSPRPCATWRSNSARTAAARPGVRIEEIPAGGVGDAAVRRPVHRRRAATRSRRPCPPTRSPPTTPARTVVDVVDRVDVLLIDGDPDGEAARAGDAFYVATALAPGAGAPTGLRPRIEPPRRSPRSTCERSTASGCSTSSGSTRRRSPRSRRYARGGGGVVFFGGPRTEGRTRQPARSTARATGSSRCRSPARSICSPAPATRTVRTSSSRTIRWWRCSPGSGIRCSTPCASSASGGRARLRAAAGRGVRRLLSLRTGAAARRRAALRRRARRGGAHDGGAGVEQLGPRQPELGRGDARTREPPGAAAAAGGVARGGRAVVVPLEPGVDEIEVDFLVPPARHRRAPDGRRRGVGRAARRHGSPQPRRRAPTRPAGDGSTAPSGSGSSPSTSTPTRAGSSGSAASGSIARSPGFRSATTAPNRCSDPGAGRSPACRSSTRCCWVWSPSSPRAVVAYAASYHAAVPPAAGGLTPRRRPCPPFRVIAVPARRHGAGAASHHEPARRGLLAVVADAGARAGRRRRDRGVRRSGCTAAMPPNCPGGIAVCCSAACGSGRSRRVAAAVSRLRADRRARDRAAVAGGRARRLQRQHDARTMADGRRGWRSAGRSGPSTLLESGGLLAALRRGTHECRVWRFDADAEPLVRAAPQRRLPTEAAAPTASPGADDWRDRLAPRGFETRLGEALGARARRRSRPACSPGVIVLTDGGNNAGVDPRRRRPPPLPRAGVPVHAVGIGSDDAAGERARGRPARAGPGVSRRPLRRHRLPAGAGARRPRCGSNSSEAAARRGAGAASALRRGRVIDAADVRARRRRGARRRAVRRARTRRRRAGGRSRVRVVAAGGRPHPGRRRAGRPRSRSSIG